jgi:hypothetical protein
MRLQAAELRNRSIDLAAVAFGASANDTEDGSTQLVTFICDGSGREGPGEDSPGSLAIYLQ